MLIPILCSHSLTVPQLEIDSDIFEKLTLTYALGDQHGLYEAMKTAQVA